MYDERIWSILTESFGKILLPGLTMTIPLTVLSFAFAIVIAVAAALVQFARVRGLRQIFVYERTGENEFTDIAYIPPALQINCCAYNQYRLMDE